MNSSIEEVLTIVGAIVGGLLVIFLLTFPTGWGPNRLLSWEARLMRLCKRRKKWNWTTIEPGLLLGSLPRWPCHLDELRKEGVGALLTLNENWELSMTSKCVQDCRMTSRQLQTPDFFAPTQRDIREAVVFISKSLKEGIGVYVHCNGGKGRSAVCVICYLIYEHGWSPDDAFRFVKGKRKIAGMKAWGGIHKQWRAVKRFARDLKAARKHAGYLVTSEQQPISFAPKNASSKVAPLQVVTGADAEPGADPPGLCPHTDCEAQTN